MCYHAELISKFVCNTGCSCLQLCAFWYGLTQMCFSSHLALPTLIQWIFVYVKVNNKSMILSMFNPILRGGGIYAHHISAMVSGRTYPRRLQVYSKFKFCNYRTHKIGPGSKKFSYGAWEPAKVGWVVDFLLRFCLKIGCIFTFHEMRWYFLAEIEL